MSTPTGENTIEVQEEQQTHESNTSKRKASKQQPRGSGYKGREHSNRNRERSSSTSVKSPVSE